MATYLIEIPHSGDPVECAKVISIFVESGSHLLSNAHWGCKDGVHKAWFINEFDSKQSALNIVPAFLKQDAIITELVSFSIKDLPEMASHK